MIVQHSDLTAKHTPTQRKKLALLINTISPARVPLYKGLASHFELLLLHGGTESNRDSWHNLDQMIPDARVKKPWGWQFRLTRKIDGKKFDYRYLHIMPGYLWHLLRFRPDVVISNEMGLRTILALLYGTLFRKSVWVWWGGTLHTERCIGRAKRIVRKTISRWAQHWISYGRSSTEYLLQLGIARDRVVEIQNSVDEQRFTTDVKPPHVRFPRPILLHVGQFTTRKGIDSLLGAAAELQTEGHQFSLVFVGNGPEKSAAKEMACKLRMRNVFFEPSRDPIAMPSAYRLADALIFPTLEDVWGLVANEAILCGVPVLCSKYAGCAEELFTPESIFDPTNSTEFAIKLRAAISGEIPPPDFSRLRTTPELLSILISALNQSLHKRPISIANTRPTFSLRTRPGGQ